MITTLLLLTLLAGFAIAAQNRALSQARILNKIQQTETAQFDLQSARAMALPLIGEALLDDDSHSAIELQFDRDIFLVELKPAQRRSWYQLILD